MDYYYIVWYFLSITIFFSGDYLIYHIINYFLLNNRNKNKYMTKKHWFLGNLCSYSILSMLYWEDMGNTYYHLDSKPILYTIFTIPINLLFTDTIFYFMHRLSHNRLLYYHFHYFHHQFRPIDSWISRTSNWIDSNLENIAFTLPFIIIPTNFYIMYGLLIFSFYWGCLIHDNKLDFGNQWFNCPKIHYIHHKYGKDNYNYSYYFTHWDRLLGTYKK